METAKLVGGDFMGCFVLILDKTANVMEQCRGINKIPGEVKTGFFGLDTGNAGD